MSTRVVDVPGRGRAIETDLGGGRVQREYIGPERWEIRPGGTMSVIDSPRRRARSSAVAPARESKERRPVFLPSLAPSYQVTLASAAVQEIRREIRSAAVDFDTEVETGGWLLASEPSPGHIVFATSPGEDAGYWRSRVELGFDECEAVLRTNPDLHLRGDWHLHPSGDELPSETDRRAWARGLELASDYWISVIALPARSGWEKPALHGWVTTPLFCERLQLVEL